MPAELNTTEKYRALYDATIAYVRKKKGQVKGISGVTIMTPADTCGPDVTFYVCVKCYGKIPKFAA